MKTNTWVELKLWRSNGAQRRNKAREIWLQAEVVEEEEEEEEERLQQRCWNCAINCVRAFLLRTCRYKDTFVSWARGRQSKYVLRTASTSISISIRTRTQNYPPSRSSSIPLTNPSRGGDLSSKSWPWLAARKVPLKTRPTPHPSSLHFRRESQQSVRTLSRSLSISLSHSLSYSFRGSRRS